VSRYSAPMIAAFLMLTTPAMAERHRQDRPGPDAAEFSRGHAGPFHEWVRGVSRAHAPRSASRRHMDPIPRIGPRLPRSQVSFVTADPFYVPPASVRYGCNEQFGGLSAVMRCAGPWLEAATQISR
jgi:hypothetical protein